MRLKTQTFITGRPFWAINAKPRLLARLQPPILLKPFDMFSSNFLTRNNIHTRTYQGYQCHSIFFQATKLPVSKNHSTAGRVASSSFVLTDDLRLSTPMCPGNFQIAEFARTLLRFYMLKTSCAWPSPTRIYISYPNWVIHSDLSALCPNFARTVCADSFL